MIIVHFENVGREKASWDAECPDEQFGYDWLYEQVKRKAHIKSDDIDFRDSPYNEWTRIYAGIHKIGECFIDGAQNETAVIIRTWRQ